MAQIFWSLEQAMVSSDPIQVLREVALRFSSQAPGAKWYLFGSYKRDPKTARDIDVLVVHQDQDLVEGLRYAVTRSSVALAVDLYIMTTSEEEEFFFVREQQAQQIFP